jgi:sortase (surface protein transpeptidase)
LLKALMNYKQILHSCALSYHPRFERVEGKVRVAQEVWSEDWSFEITLSNYLAKIAKAFAIAGAVFLAVSFAPSFWYWLKGAAKNTSYLVQTAEGSPVSQVAAQVEEPYQPKLDPSLPTEARLTIPSVGIDTQIWEATSENYEEVLQKGVWRVADFGTPFNRARPTILAAHRFGYLKWSIPYRLKNSFFNLPKLKVGETVEIIWRQRKYVYEVYAADEGEAISDYSADLILYTCESLDSPVRLFRYARLLEI